MTCKRLLSSINSKYVLLCNIAWIISSRQDFCKSKISVLGNLITLFDSHWYLWTIYSKKITTFFLPLHEKTRWCPQKLMKIIPDCDIANLKHLFPAHLAYLYPHHYLWLQYLSLCFINNYNNFNKVLITKLYISSCYSYTFK